MVSVKDIAVTSLDTITAFDLSTGAYLFTIDELQSASIANTQDKEDIVGKQGRKITSLKRNKACTISGENGLISAGVMELQVGKSFASKATEVMWTDYLTITAGSDSTREATTTYKAIGTTGAEIVSLYLKNTDGTVDTELTQAASAAEGKYAYDPSTKKISFFTSDTTATVGKEIVVVYKRKITANVLENESETYSGKATLYVDGTGEDTCGNIYRIQYYIPKADFSGEFSFDMGDSQTMHSFEAESLVNGCAGGNLWTYTIFGVDTADYTAS